MKATSFMIPALLCLAFTTDCRNVEAPHGSGKSQETGHAETSTSPGTGHAQAGVKPGSHEDWCAEHQVPESLCTQCNPSLIAAFKATGDWCEEHGLPESQCRICNPDLKIVRPLKEGGR